MSEQLPCTLRSHTVSWLPPFGSRRSKRRTRPSWCVVKKTCADSGTNFSFMPMPASDGRSASWPSRPSPPNNDTACGESPSGSLSHLRRGRLRSAPAAKPRARSTRRTSPSPATVTHALDPLFGTNSAEKMLCTCPVYTDPRQGNALPNDHTQTHRSSLPLSNKDASSFQETAFTQPACFSRAAVSRRPRISHGWPTCGSRRRRASHWRRVTPSNTEVRPEGSGPVRNIAEGARARPAAHAARLGRRQCGKRAREGSESKQRTPDDPSHASAWERVPREARVPAPVF